MHDCVCVFFSGGWRLLAITEPWRVQSNSQGSGLRPHQQEMRGGLRHGHQHLRLHHRPHQPVTDQRNHGEIQQAAHQIAPQAAPSSAVQRETSGNIMIVEWLLGLGGIKEQASCCDQAGVNAKHLSNSSRQSAEFSIGRLKRWFYLKWMLYLVLNLFAFVSSPHMNSLHVQGRFLAFELTRSCKHWARRHSWCVYCSC